MKTINSTEARNNFSSLLDSVVENSEYAVITRRDKPNTVLMSQDYFNSIMETLHLLSTPTNAAHIAESIAQHKQGKTQPHDLIDA